MSVFRRTQTAPLQLVINNRGPVTGATVVVAVRRKETTDSYMDFADDTFKTAGHGVRQVSVPEVGDGRYVYLLDLAAITNLPATTERLTAEFEVTTPRQPGAWRTTRWSSTPTWTGLTGTSIWPFSPPPWLGSPPVARPPPCSRAWTRQATGSAARPRA